MFDADIGKTLLYGITLAIPAILISGPLLTRFLPKVEAKPLKEQLAVFRLVLEILSLDEVGEEDERRLAGLAREYKFYKAVVQFYVQGSEGGRRCWY